MRCFTRRRLPPFAPMIKLRFFGSFDYGTGDLDKSDVVRLAYEKGVPMGGDLEPGSGKHQRSW